MTAEPGSWWLVLLGGLAGQAVRVAEADRRRATLLATVSHDLRAPLAAAKAAVSGLRAGDARLTTDDRADLLTAWTAGNRVELRVVDHGPGIPAADRKRVFQPFCRLGALGDRTGVGLGLAVARGLAEAMGGTVEPEDTPGGGLTMVLTLPAAPARTAAEPRGTRRMRAA